MPNEEIIIIIIIDIAIPADYNKVEKRIEKIQKYGDLVIEITKSWHLTEAVIIPVIIGATGGINKNLEEDICKLATNKDIRQILKIPLMGTTCIIRKFLSNDLM